MLVVAAGLIALNQYCKTADYTVYQTSENVNLVAHRGFRAVAPENTAPAFEEAGKAGFTVPSAMFTEPRTELGLFNTILTPIV